jgi:hypothetical protein
VNIFAETEEDEPEEGDTEEGDREDVSDIAEAVVRLAIGHHKAVIALRERCGRGAARYEADRYPDVRDRDSAHWDRWSDVLAELADLAGRGLAYAVCATDDEVNLKHLDRPETPFPVASVELRDEGLVLVRTDPTGTGPKIVEVIYADRPAIGDQICG